MVHGGRGKRISKAEAQRRRARQKEVEKLTKRRVRTTRKDRNRAARERARRSAPTIRLNEAIKTPTSADTRGLGAKTLDVISSTLLEPTTFIRSPSRAGRLVAERRARTFTLSTAVGTVSETLVAAGALAGGITGVFTSGGRIVAARVLPKLIPRTPKSILLTATGTGILVTSETARRFVARTIEDPTRAGREAGILGERLAKGQDVGGFKEGLKKAGLIGAGLVGTGLLIAGAKKLLTRKKTPVAAPLQPSQPISNLGSAPTVTTPGLPTPTVEQVIIPTISEKEGLEGAPVTVTTNIKIDNRSSSNRRFINTIHA